MGRKTWIPAVALVVGVVFHAAHGCADQRSTPWQPKQEKNTRLLATYTDHTGTVLALAFKATDSTRLVSGGQDKTDRDKTILRFWDVARGKCVLTATDLPGDVLALAWSPNGKSLLLSTANYYDKYTGALRTSPKVMLWEPSRVRCVKSIDRGQFNEQLSLAFSPDCQQFVMAGMGKNFEVWSAGTAPDKIMHKRLLMGHDSHVLSVAFSPDGTRIASGSMDGTVKIWEPAKITGILLRTLEGHSHSVNSVAWSLDGKSVASGSSDKTVKVWDIATGQCRLTLEGHTESVNAVAISPDGRHVVSAGNDGTLRVWDAASGRCLQTLAEHQGSIEAMAMSADGLLIATGGADKTVRVWVMGRYGK